jgi:Neuraminidase (sialidase)
VWLSYGSDGKVYLVAAPINASLDINTLNQAGIIASVSNDNGQTWSNPHFLAASQDYINESTLLFPSNDKPSITANPKIAGAAYAVWTNFPSVESDHGDVFLSCTTDGGLTWCPHFTIYDPFNDATLESMSNGIYNNVSAINNIIVVLPNGDLLNFMTRIYATPGATDLEFVEDVWPYQFSQFDIAVIRSTDGGLTWETDATQIATMDGNSTFTNGYTYSGTTITGGVGAETSTEGSNKFFNVNVNPSNGNLYVVWQSGQFTENQLPQIALSASRDGGLTWTEPVMISRTPVDSDNPQAFTPAVAITKKGHLAVLYHDFRKDNNNVDLNQTKTNVWLAEYDETYSPFGGSTGVGLNFKTEVRVNKHSYIMQNGPMVAGQFITNGNYNRVVAHGKDDFYAVYVKSNPTPFEPPIT